MSACLHMAHVPCDECGGFHPPNWIHDEPCCDLDVAARRHSAAIAQSRALTNVKSLRNRILTAAATTNVDQTGTPVLSTSRNGTPESLTINGVDLFKWFATAWDNGLVVHVRLEVVP
jgi:hypothetical protein